MLRSVFIVILLPLLSGIILSCGSSGDVRVNDDLTEDVLLRLDSVIVSRDSYIGDKERRLDSLKSLVPSADDEGRYRLYDRIFGEYYSYDLDSAVMYATRKAVVAEGFSGGPRLSVARLNLARVLLARGRVPEAVTQMRQALPDTVFPVVKAIWYDFMVAYESMNGHNPLPWYERMSVVLDSASSDWIYNESNLLRLRGNLKGAAEVLDTNRNHIPTNPRNMAITNYLLGRIYLQRRDTVAAIRSIAASAVYDMMTPVRDYKSLYELAALLLATGDVDRAYRYIDLAVEDANSTKVLDNMVAVNGIMPQIVRAHERQMQRERDIQRWFVVGISLLAICLVGALVLTIRSRNAVGRAAVREKELNSRLREINRELEAMNGRISESNKVKDAYLVQYFNLCSYFVGRFEEFRGNVSSAARSKGLAGVEKLLAAADDDRELKKFYSNFDATFLSLFPGFVDNLNRLLAPDKQVALNRDGSMSNELRTFALIRLGLTDSEQIAGFLRRSVSTIYNYRVKMRNAAVCPREEFEDKVIEIKP